MSIYHKIFVNTSITEDNLHLLSKHMYDYEYLKTLDNDKKEEIKEVIVEEKNDNLINRKDPLFWCMYISVYGYDEYVLLTSGIDNAIINEKQKIEVYCSLLLDAFACEFDNPRNFEEVVNLVSRVISIIERNATLERQFSGLPCLSSPDLDLYFSPTLMSSVEQDVLKGNFFSNLPDEIRIGAILRGEEIIIPRSSYVFQKNDTVLLLSKRDQLPVVENMFRISSV